MSCVKVINKFFSCLLRQVRLRYSLAAVHFANILSTICKMMDIFLLFLHVCLTQHETSYVLILGRNHIKHYNLQQI